MHYTMKYLILPLTDNLKPSLKRMESRLVSEFTKQYISLTKEMHESINIIITWFILITCIPNTDYYTIILNCNYTNVLEIKTLKNLRPNLSFIIPSPLSYRKLES